MKKILILFVLSALIIHSQDNAYNEIKLSGNFSLDAKLIQQGMQEDKNNRQIYLEEKKSPLLAALMSLAVPGAGDLYNGDIWNALGFIVVEAAAVTTAIMYDSKGDDKTAEYEGFANEHWSAERYAEWTVQNASRINSNVDPNNYNVFDNNGNVNWQQLNMLESEIGSWYSHQLAPFGHQQYYEMIGKYSQFNSGWDDFSEDPEDPFTYGDPLTERFLYYSGERAKANDFYTVAKWAVIGVVTNHIVGAIEAAWSANRHNKALEMELGIEKEQMGFYTEYYPKLSVQVRF